MVARREVGAVMREFELGDMVVLSIEHCAMPLWVELHPDGTFVRQKGGAIRPGEMAVILESREVDAGRGRMVRIACGGGTGWIGALLLDEVEGC